MTGRLFAIGQVHGYDVVIRDEVPVEGIAAERRKGNEVPLGMTIGPADRQGMTGTISSSLRRELSAERNTSPQVGYSCALTS